MLRWPVEPMRAAGSAELPPTPRGRELTYQPKWDGFRALAWTGGQVRNDYPLSYESEALITATAVHDIDVARYQAGRRRSVGGCGRRGNAPAAIHPDRLNAA